MIINLLLFILIHSLIVIYESKISKRELKPTGLSNILKLMRFFYPVVLILYFFKQMYYLTPAINPKLYDVVLIKIDYWMFGENPTQWFNQFATPFLTEFLQIIYSLYYVVILVYGLELYLWNRINEFYFAAFTILAGFYISYLLYLLLPAVGPRFFLHNFYSINQELPGLLFTEYLRTFLDFAESIPKSSSEPQNFAQRDAMPSLHTVIVIILSYLSYKIKSKSFYFYIIYSIIMLISAIYLRYHYVIDIIAGGVVAIFTILVCSFIYRIKTVQHI